MNASPIYDLNNIPPPVFSVIDKAQEIQSEWFEDFLPYDFLKFDTGFSLTLDEQLKIWPHMILIGDLDFKAALRIGSALNLVFFPVTNFYRFISDPKLIFIHRQIFSSDSDELFKEEFFIKDISDLEFYVIFLANPAHEKEYQMRHRKYKIQKLIKELCS